MKSSFLLPALLSIHLSLWPTEASAQRGWFWQSPQPVGDGLGSVHFVSATEGWMTSEGGQILHTMDAGTTWSVQTPDSTVVLSFTGQPGPSLYFINGTTGWVLATLGGKDNPSGPRLYKTTNAGATWSQQDIGSGNYGFGVQFIDANNGWSIIFGGTLPNSLNSSIRRSTNGGSSWATQYSTTSGNVTLGISFVDTNNGWAIVDSFVNGKVGSPSSILHTTNGGTDWTLQLRDTSKGGFDALQFIDANNGWVVGDSAKILRTTNGGSTWTAVTNSGIFSSSQNKTVFFLDVNNGWIGSQPKEATSDTGKGGSPAVLHTTNGGISWTAQSPSVQYAVFSLHFVNANNGWLAADYGGIAHTTNGGATWVLQSKTVTNSGLYAIATLPDGNNIWAVGGDAHGGGSGIILHTTNGGINWAPQTIPTSNSIQSVSFTDVNTGTAVGKTATILRTTNGGSNWATQTNPSSGTSITFWGVSFTDANTGTAVGAGGTILRTTNGGTTWQPQASGTTKALFGVHFSDANNGTIVADSGAILHTTNGGTTWTKQASGTSQRLFRVFCTDANVGTAAGDGGTILRTTNGGGTWVSQTSGTTNTLEGVTFTDVNRGFVVGYGGIILRTTNGGGSWSRDVSGTVSDLWAISFSNNTVGTIVGSYGHGTILRTTTGGTFASVQQQRQAEIPAWFVLKQNYPNPFNPSTTIEYQIPRQSFVTLKVFDVLGREVATLANEKKDAGDYLLRFDASGLGSGVYFYRLHAGDFTLTRRLLLLK